MQILTRVLVGAIAFGVTGCANVTPLASTTSQIHANIDRPPSLKTYQWVDFGTAANQYDYPKSSAPTGKKVHLYGSSGECTSGKATFWIVYLEGETAEELSYDGKYIQSLTPTSSASAFQRCAVSGSGDVAFTAPHQVVIFKHGLQSNMSAYPISQAPDHAGYDAAGDLFIDATSTSKKYALLELAAGGKSFQNVSLPNELQSVGPVQWDGTYIAATDPTARKIYRYAIVSYAATLEGTVSLRTRYACAEAWITPPRVFCSNSYQRKLGNKATSVYKYPGGGNAITRLAGFGGSIVQVSR